METAMLASPAETYDVAIALRCIVQGATVKLSGAVVIVGERVPTPSMYAPDNILIQFLETGESKLVSEDTLVMTRRVKSQHRAKR